MNGNIRSQVNIVAVQRRKTLIIDIKFNALG